MTSKTVIDNLEREAIYNILIAIQQRWQYLEQSEVEECSVNSNLSMVTDCAVDGDADSLMAETMIAQRADFVASPVDSIEAKESQGEMNETVILTPSWAPSVAPTPVAEQSAAVAGNSAFSPDSDDAVNDNSHLEQPDDADSLAKTQILSRFSNEKVESMAPVSSDNSIPEDANFAATVILNSSATGYPKSQSIPKPPESLSEGNDDLDKTCILQPFNGSLTKSPAVENKTVAPDVADNQVAGDKPPDSLLETVIMPSGIGKKPRQ